MTLGRPDPFIRKKPRWTSPDDCAVSSCTRWGPTPSCPCWLTMETVQAGGTTNSRREDVHPGADAPTVREWSRNTVASSLQTVSLTLHRPFWFPRQLNLLLKNPHMQGFYGENKTSNYFHLGNSLGFSFKYCLRMPDWFGLGGVG